MSYKVVRKNEAYEYQAAGHFKVLTTRLHDPEDVNDGRITMGLSHFLPGGGTEFGSNALESIYYIVSGEMTLTTEDGETVLHAGDSFHCGPHTKKSVRNTGAESCQMLVCLVKPEA
ncbi:MAG TPA: cupin domain-containing protein [Clostridiales bacterium]|nr:cupin domain-containing protein [Clostridiales bacterium]